MAEQPKLQVVKIFLAMIAKHVSNLREAVLATLGGYGIEAELWQNAGVQPENGWLIENGRKLSSKLIKGFNFRNCGNLETFPDLFSGAKGKSAGVDGFHLDLCGTIEPKLNELANILPLVRRGIGHCLAVTVADARKNLTLEHFPEADKELQKVLGKKHDEFLENLLCEQNLLAEKPGATFDPENGEKREAGFFLTFVNALSKIKGSKVFLPDFLERYVYVSRYGKKPFRMRTYLFHFGHEFIERKKVALSLAQLWQKSELFEFSSGSFKPVSVSVVPQPQPQKEVHMVMPEVSNLQALAEAAGGNALRQFQDLMEYIKGFGKETNLLDSIQDLLACRISTNGGAGSQPVARQPLTTQTETVSDNGSVAVKDELDVKLDLLRASVQGSVALEKAYEQAYKDLGITGRKYTHSRRRKVAGMFSWTGEDGPGRFRNNFVRVCYTKYGDGILAELAKLYNKPGDLVTEADLRALVK